MLAPVLHALVTVALLAGYVIVTLAGFEADALLGVLVGYLGGAAAQTGADAVTGSRTPR